MFAFHSIHRFASASAPLALVCAVAIPQEIEPRVAPVPASTAVQDPASPWMLGEELVGLAVVTTKDVEDVASPATVGRVTDLIVDAKNFTVPFLVVDVAEGPRTAIAWHAARWNAAAKTFTVDASVAELRSRAEIEPDHLETLLGPESRVADADAKRGEDTREVAEVEPLPRLLLASRIPGHAAQARDGGAFGKIYGVLVDPARGDVPAMILAAGDRLHVVPGSLASLARTGEKTIALRFDRDLDTLRETPRLDREDVTLADARFRARVFQAVGLTPRSEVGSEVDRR